MSFWGFGGATATSRAARWCLGRSSWGRSWGSGRSFNRFHHDNLIYIYYSYIMYIHILYNIVIYIYISLYILYIVKKYAIWSARVSSASYVGAVAMRHMICQYICFCFSLEFGTMVVRLTLAVAILAILQRLKGQIQARAFGHDHGRIRNLFDPLSWFVPVWWFLQVARVLKVFVGVLNAKLVADFP